ncbi:glycerophosphodiester phosphodiesterase family protein [Mesorhizobium australicum]|uniref:Glycerophosphoryl diester phosphodiesterase n=1 Tax=Mesorhizobium australicum TaxID=536018 RepID=A0A1X7P4A8_9HYPH|nr:glycerophosphodiester phosphodiesterase family protein [Mesorhizobium australicum]SMH44823.1 glycerophosphoryl diester phosphodiesterase [Mesorhizobium australicum]
MRAIIGGILLSVLLGCGLALADAGRVGEIRERLSSANQWRDHVMVVAHRAGGLQARKSRFPENSRAALADAISIGAEMVEIDVQKSSDGTYVVVHDTWLDRTTNCRGEVADRTLAELRTCQLVVEGTSIPTDEAVPTLAEYLEAARGRIMVNIDNKLAPDDLVGMTQLAERLGLADHLVVKLNLWNEERIAEAHRLIGLMPRGVIFMPIVADDAVRDPGLLERVTSTVSADAVELIAWHKDGQPMTPDGGPLFGTRARAVAVRGGWHLWVNTYGIVNKSAGMLAGGRGDQLAVEADLPGEAFGFWVDRGATIIQTDEPGEAIRWLDANGYRRPYAAGTQQAAAR